MKTRELKRIVRKAGCIFVREGSNHEVWYSPLTGKEFQIPRHKKEVKTGTAESILKSAGVKRRQ